MPAYTTQDIRNIALVGQSGAGKTTLVEALLYHAGAIQNQGTIDRGDTICDFDPQEKHYEHSLDAAVAHLTTDNTHVNLLDTPGLIDFFGRSFGVLQAAETTAVVINAEAGIEPATLAMMEHAKNDDLCRAIIINKIDADNLDLEGLLNQVRATFGDVCLPLNLPSAEAGKVVDCFFSPDGEATAFSSVADAHTNIVDQVVEMDEQLMELYLEQGQELKPAQLHDPFEAALRDGHLIPICFVSAKSGAGIKQLLKIISRLLPDPTEGNPPHFQKGESPNARPVEVSPDPDKHIIAHVFKISNDPFKGKLSYLRVYQGTITPNSQLLIGDSRKPFKPAHLYQIQGNTQTEIQRAIPGDICAIARIDELFRDAVLHDSHDEDHFHLQPEQFPMPLFGLALIPQKRGDEQKLSDALLKISSEDPCLTIEHDTQTNETVIRGMGELHLRIVLEQLEQRYNVHVDTKPPSIAYRETISSSGEGHYRHKKQTGGAGQFGEVSLRVAPLARGEGFVFIDEVKGGVIPGQFIPAVEKGVRLALEEGFIAGYPIQDLQVTVFDGKYHAVDSKEIAFVTAGKKAFHDALNKARPIVLEPVVNINIIASGDAMGDITADLSVKRGRINNTEMTLEGRMVISGMAPLAELDSYSTKLKSMTGGEGTYEISFSHYDPVPDNVQRTLAEKHQQHIHHQDEQ
ncbi:elongation factor G [Sedimenticola selenatireducens]|uniref:Elongation factor G n=1 Tax=Sedimenticola selenatireducens TaxID=191960 RepID=A0A558DWH9_9GAMM|nr:elongation factor G [Sedimenticola selenatireducens]TVO75490.1 elongation factor G [Sedimenticola selenatireducens]TVT65396.1 MAG: elongation factor G [Sedimenticola selenatireducens]